MHSNKNFYFLGIKHNPEHFDSIFNDYSTVDFLRFAADKFNCKLLSVVHVSKNIPSKPTFNKRHRKDLVKGKYFFLQGSLRNVTKCSVLFETFFSEIQNINKLKFENFTLENYNCNLLNALSDTQNYKFSERPLILDCPTTHELCSDCENNHHSSLLNKDTFKKITPLYKKR